MGVYDLGELISDRVVVEIPEIRYCEICEKNGMKVKLNMYHKGRNCYHHPADFKELEKNSKREARNEGVASGCELFLTQEIYDAFLIYLKNNSIRYKSLVIVKAIEEYLKTKPEGEILERIKEYPIDKKLKIFYKLPQRTFRHLNSISVSLVRRKELKMYMSKNDHVLAALEKFLGINS